MVVIRPKVAEAKKESPCGLSDRSLTGDPSVALATLDIFCLATSFGNHE